MWATKPVLRLRFLFVISCMYSIRIQRFTLKIIYYFLKFYLHIKNINVNLKTLASYSQVTTRVNLRVKQLLLKTIFKQIDIVPRVKIIEQSFSTIFQLKNIKCIYI